MDLIYSALESAIKEVARLRGILKRKTTAQVQSADELSLIKATPLAWFNNHRRYLETVAAAGDLDPVDAQYKALLSLSDRHPSRVKCDSLLKELKGRMSKLRTQVATRSPTYVHERSSENAPDFSTLISDGAMQHVLSDRWHECTVCIEAGAPLAATVMMGGLLEGLLLARVHREPNKTPVFSAKAAPKDKATGKALPLSEWTLKNYIGVAHELQWISRPAKDLGEILRDYRNYVHPHKQLTQAIKFQTDDVAIFWEVAKGICRQLVKRAV